MKVRPLYIGDNAAGEKQFLTPEERTMGVQAIGTVGSGKSQSLNMQIAQDECHLPGAVLEIDVHGNDPNSPYAQALARAVRYRPRRPTYFINLSRPRWVYGFNIFAGGEGGDASTRVQHCIRRLFTAWGESDPYERPRLLYWSNAVFTTGMHHHGEVSLSELRLLLDHEQAALRSHLTAGTPVASRWQALNHKRLDQFDEQVEAVRNRIDALTSAAGPRRFLSLNHPPAMLDFQRVFAERACVHVNLQESDQLDRDHARIIGTLLVADFVEQACQRPDAKRFPVSVFIDEAHRFVGQDLAMAFVEGRKFSIFTTLAHQYLDQLREEQDDRVLNAILTCARTKMVFALGSDRDAKALVHEIFVGPQGLDYTEVKHTAWQTKFRPIADRDTTTSRSHGGGTSLAEGENETRSHGRTFGTGEAHTETQGRNGGHSRSDGWTTTHGSTTGETRTIGATHTVGRTANHSVAEGVTEAHTTSHAHSVGKAETVAHTRNRGRTRGATTTTTQAVTTTLDADGAVTQTRTQSASIQAVWTNVEGFSHAKTQSEAVTDGVSHTTGRSRVVSRGTSASESDADTMTQGQTNTDSSTSGQTETATDSEGWSDSEGRTESRSRTDSRSQSRGRNRSKTESASWSNTIADVPVTRHEEFREPSVTFFSLEEQRQRRADMLRLPPQRSFTLRRADCSSGLVTVPFRKPLQFSSRLLLKQEGRSATKTGAVAIQEADTRIETRQQRTVERAAVVELEAPTPGTRIPRRNTTYSLPYEREPRPIAAKRVRPTPRLNPAIAKAKPPEGSNR